MLLVYLFYLEEIITSVQANIKIELLNYGTLTQIPIIKTFFLFTSHHTTKPSNYFIN